ncbi:MAG: glycosyl hydrolase [Limisphaerales bacterium]
MNKFKFLTGLLALLAVSPVEARDAPLETIFHNPPKSAKPWTYWFWINGNITKEGITADLEAMSRVGIGGVLIMEVANPKSMAPVGPIAFAGPEWRDMFKHVVKECARLGLEVNMNNDAGWCGSGGPWITPEFSMQKLVATNTTITGGQHVVRKLPKPPSSNNYYRDIKVLAYPAVERPLLAPKNSVLDIIDKLNVDGTLTWDVPAGKWKICRIGCTTTGQHNKPAPQSGTGLECDKFSAQAAELHFNNFINKLANDVGPNLGKVFTTTHIDSWEVGSQDWTARMPEEFRKRRGYDLTPWLLALTGRVTVENDKQTDRFKRDYLRTEMELNDENYAGAFRKLAHKRGLQLSIEAYGTGNFLNSLTYAEHCDLPMSEFWINRWDAWHLLSSRLMASVAHVKGQPFVGAESFTATADRDAFTEHPYSVKTTGDWAFCEGVNRFVFHRTALNPWPNLQPGMSFAGYGWHMDRNQTWFQQGAAYMQYLTRSQALLQQGQFVADICRLVPDGENFSQHQVMEKLTGQFEPIPAGYNCDYISDNTLLNDIAVKHRLLTTRAGMTYRVLQLPNTKALTPEITHKLRALARSGAIIVGPKPDHSPSLQNFPAADSEVKKLAAEAGPNWTTSLTETLCQNFSPDFTFTIDLQPTPESLASITHGVGKFSMPTSGLNWIHRRTRDAEIYFIANPQYRDVEAICTFRVEDRQPELWDALTGDIGKPAEFTSTNHTLRLPIHFDTAGSIFVVFRKEPNPAIKIIANGKHPSATTGAITIIGPWTAQFPQKDGQSIKTTFDSLTDWSKHNDPQIRYFSGTATYETDFEFSAAKPNEHWQLNLGDVQVIAEVTLNGNAIPRNSQPADALSSSCLWKPPFTIDITHSLKPGLNHLKIKVTNLWPNRLIGDEQFPDDCTPDSSWLSGRLPNWPDWFLKGQPRPEPRRQTFTTWKYYTKDSPLVSSGLLGPVTLTSCK